MIAPTYTVINIKEKHRQIILSVCCHGGNRERLKIQLVNLFAVREKRGGGESPK